MEINVSQPWFGLIARGKKKIEGRLCKGKFADVKPSTIFIVKNEDANVAAVVSYVKRYPSFHEYLSKEGLARTLPGVTSRAKGVAVYRKFYSENDEHLYGVVAIHFRLLESASTGPVARKTKPEKS